MSNYNPKRTRRQKFFTDNQVFKEFYILLTISIFNANNKFFFIKLQLLLFHNNLVKKKFGSNDYVWSKNYYFQVPNHSKTGSNRMFFLLDFLLPLIE